MTDALPLNDTTEPLPTLTVQDLHRIVRSDLRHGARFAGLFACIEDADPVPDPDSDLPGVILQVVMVGKADVVVHRASVGSTYPSLTSVAPSAFWYERVVHDLFGIVPDGHPRLDPLVLPLPSGTDRCQHPPAIAAARSLIPDERSVPRHVRGRGLFTIPHGPVRSGVMESVEYLVETPGEDIPHLQVRIYAKHRAVQQAFRGRTVEDGVLVAERVEGVAGVAHAIAFCRAVESIAGIQSPPAAAFIRVLHAELERIANHLDVAVRLCDAAGLAVAGARFSTHKERVMRLRDELCGSRFGRGVIVPGGVQSRRPEGLERAAGRLKALRSQIDGDAKALMATSSFLDRVRTTGPLSPATARRLGSLGPVGRASGYHDDARVRRPYEAYASMGPPTAAGAEGGDALARLKVRWHEIGESFFLAGQSIDQLTRFGPGSRLRAPVPPASGRGIGWAEAPQGEVLYVVDLVDGMVRSCWPRSASLHNLALFHEVFVGDVLTDFPFIEASFGLSIAGAAS